MEDICEVCQKSAEITCSCDTSVRYCSKDYVFVHKLSRENHIPIELSKRRQEIYQKFISTIKTLNEVKFQIINKSDQLVHIIQLITSKKISLIKKIIDACVNASKSKNLDTEKMFKSYQNIEFKQSDLESFVQISTKNFLIFKNDNEIIDSELEIILNETKLKQFKFSKSLKKLRNNHSQVSIFF